MLTRNSTALASYKWLEDLPPQTLTYVFNAYTNVMLPFILFTVLLVLLHTRQTKMCFPARSFTNSSSRRVNYGNVLLIYLVPGKAELEQGNAERAPVRDRVKFRADNFKTSPNDNAHGSSHHHTSSFFLHRAQTLDSLVELDSPLDAA